MKNTKAYLKRLLALTLALALIVTGMPTALGAEQTDNNVQFSRTDGESVSASLLLDEAKAENIPEEPTYEPNDTVRVSILLDKPSTIAAGYSTANMAQNSKAMTYRADLEKTQANVEVRIARQALNGNKLDVVWNLTLAANLISANVAYGQIEAIKAVSGVKDVIVETRYYPDVYSVEGEAANPDMLSSSPMIGSSLAWEEGYTGAGTRIAIIDTGLDEDHQSFDNEAYLYALEENARTKGENAENYMASLNPLDEEEIAFVLPRLNAYRRDNSLTARELLQSDKIAFGYNYIDRDLDITHDNDNEGGHGSHVAGIASANRFIESSEGSFGEASAIAHTVGVAPDAQLIVMKVFGKNGGAWDSDYMAAVEDAIILNCDSVNLSLGSAYPGETTSAVYQELLDSLEKTNTVMTVSAGNNNAWPVNSNSPAKALYAEDIGMNEVGSPGSYEASFTVASADNRGYTGTPLKAGDLEIRFDEPASDNESIISLDTSSDHSGTEYDYVFLDGLGLEEDYEGIDVSGKIVILSRGAIPFTEKHLRAQEKGAVAAIIYNNVPGAISMNLSSGTATIPCISISQDNGNALRSISESLGEGVYKGKATVTSRVVTDYGDSAYDVMSSFSSWGVPGNLSLKPEITAPGGEIYSVNGDSADTDKYISMSGTSMSAPQVAGMAALLAQYIEEKGLDKKTGLTQRALIQSLLMSTATPVIEEESGLPYPVIKQGAGLANIHDAMAAQTYITLDSQTDGKVKAELGDDPLKEGVYSFSFKVSSLSEADTAYTLNTEVFTQDVFEYYATHAAAESQITTAAAFYMSQSLARLGAEVRYSINGITSQGNAMLNSCDFDGDGDVDTQDAQRLLDYVTGKAQNLHQAENADLSGDGEVSTYDAHLLLAMLKGQLITVGPGQTVTVDVSITLPETVKAYLDSIYTGGAYVEAYVSLNAVADEEGVLSSSHSIPVLAFYGSFTDASMFDNLTYTELLAGTADRESYTGSLNNYIVARYGEEYAYFGGNPYAVDEEYLPERNAISSTNDCMIYNMYFGLIRNAGQTRILFENRDTGEAYVDLSQDDVTGMFYYSADGAWYNYPYVYAAQWPVTDARGQALEDGTPVQLAVMAAPEYNVAEDGSVDWSKLGDGAALSIPVTVDNTAPRLKTVQTSSVYDFDRNRERSYLKVTVTDNEYAAAVLLLDNTQSEVLARSAVNQASKGNTTEVEIEITELKGSSLMLAVIDYAGNAAYYEIDLGGRGEEEEEGTLLYGFSPDSFGWVSYDLASQTVTDLTSSDYYWEAGDYFKGHVFAAQGNELYVMRHGSFENPQLVGILEDTPSDMAYNPGDGMLYYTTNYSTDLYRINPVTGVSEVAAELDKNYYGLSCAPDGTFYGIASRINREFNVKEAVLYAFTLENADEPDELGTQAGCDPSKGYLAYDDSKAALFWSSLEYGEDFWDPPIYKMYRISAGDGSFLKIGEPSLIACLYMPEAGTENDSLEPSTQPLSLELTSGVTTVFPTDSETLEYRLSPWNLEDKSVVWTSSNPEIARVEDGVITGVKSGSATITVASALDPGVSDTIDVTVMNSEYVFYGIGQSDEGPALFTYKNDTDELGSGANVQLDSVESAVMDVHGNLWVQDGTGRKIHKLDPASGQSLAQSDSGASLNFWDMAYYEQSGGLLGINLHSVYGPSTITDTAFGGDAFYESPYSPPSIYVGAAAGSQSEDLYDPQTVYLLDNMGNILNLSFYYDEEFGEYYPDGRDISSDLMSQPGFSFKTSGGNYQESLVYDEETDILFLSHKKGNATEIYALVYKESSNLYHAVLLGTVSGYTDLALYSVKKASDVTSGSLTDVTTRDAVQLPLEEDGTIPGDGTELTTGDAFGLSLVKAKAASPVNSPRLTSLAGMLHSVAKDREAATALSLLNESNASFKKSGDTLILTLYAAEDTTNGLYKISFDPGKTSLISSGSGLGAASFALNEGEIAFGYASPDAVDKGSILATLTFSYPSAVTDIKITAAEINDRYVSDTYTQSVGTASPEGNGGAETPVAVNPATPSPTPVPPTESEASGQAAGFKDMDPAQWYYESVDYMVSRGYMSGTSQAAFMPDLAMSRSMLVSILYRIAGQPEPQRANPFNDVPEGQWYTQAVIWAAENGITYGTGSNSFSPHDPVTREQAAVILYRYASLVGKVAVSGSSLDLYTDASLVHEYALDGVNWAISQGVISGVGNARLGLGEMCTRSQAAAILYRFLHLE